jgi:hypothetical protein
VQKQTISIYSQCSVFCFHVLSYGWPGQQALALTEALEKSWKQHPQCPYGCKTVNGWWEGELYNFIAEEHHSLIDQICVKDNKYMLYPNPQTLIDTCVGFHEENLQQCPLSSYVFCSSTDSG